MDYSKWAESEIQALIRIGVNPIDARRSTLWTLAHLPAGADPAKWIPTAVDLTETIDASKVQDARIAWYERKPAKIRQLLSPVVK